MVPRSVCTDDVLSLDIKVDVKFHVIWALT